MIRALALTLAAAGCGSSSTPARAPDGATPKPTAAAVPTRDHLCARVQALHAARCAPFDDVDAALLARCTVAESLYLAGAQGCVDAEDCDAVHACMIDVARTGAPYVGPTGPCALPPDGRDVPVGVTARELDASYGARDRTFADSPSSVQQPIEVCGMPAETGYLTRVTCADGSRAFADRAAATEARTGRLGPGGRCARTIDHYAVACPERAYDVFIDPYRCLARAG